LKNELSDPVSARVEERLLQVASQLSEIRRHLHQHPELSGEEYSTTDYLSKQLTAACVPHRVGTGKCGVITEIVDSPESGAPVIAMRADIDALPITEESNVSYRSKNLGVMHACGHDAHSAILLGTTVALYRARPLPVAWRSIFQPSEEAGRGAVEMVKQGALDGVDAIIALHVDPNLPVGKVAITPGPRTAFCQDFTIEVTARGPMRPSIRLRQRRISSRSFIKQFRGKQMRVNQWWSRSGPLTPDTPQTLSRTQHRSKEPFAH